MVGAPADKDKSKQMPRLCRIAALWQPVSHRTVVSMRRYYFTIEALAAMIARSPIVIASRAVQFPAGYDDVDVAVLEWIAAEGRRIGRSFPLM